MPPSLNRPVALREVTYSTLTPAREAVERVSDAVLGLRSALDDVERSISHERPSREALDAALRALDELPARLSVFEAAVTPRRMQTLRRRLERLRERPRRR